LIPYFVAALTPDNVPMQAANMAAEQVEAAVNAAEEGVKTGNTLETTAKAAVAAWRAAQVTHHPCFSQFLFGQRPSL
jgi:hypothetical protein